MSRQRRPGPEPLSDATAELSNESLLDRGLGVGAIVFMVVAGAAPLGTAVAVFPAVISASQRTVTPLYFVAASIILVSRNVVKFTRRASR